VEVARSHSSVEYLLEPYWRTVCADIAYRSPLLHSPWYALSQVRLSTSQVKCAVERGLCKKVSAAHLPPPFVSFCEAVGIWLVMDRKPGLGRLIVHPKVLNDTAPPPRSFYFPTPFHIIRDLLRGKRVQVRVVDARSYYWQFLCPSALRDALRFWFDG